MKNINLISIHKWMHRNARELTLLQNDVWSISWSWFENKDKFPKESSISENWCKAYKAIDKVIFLKNFGRIDEVL